MQVQPNGGVGIGEENRAQHDTHATQIFPCQQTKSEVGLVWLQNMSCQLGYPHDCSYTEKSIFRKTAQYQTKILIPSGQVQMHSTWQHKHYNKILDLIMDSDSCPEPTNPRIRKLVG